MKKSTVEQLAAIAILCAAIQTTPAHAQSRTWVASNGDDGFPCSRTAPCKTFAGAISKTAAGGEISVVDSAGYGAVLINKAITINGEGNLASIVAGAGTAINIAAGATDRVVIRNLSLNGTGGGNIGIAISTGNVTIDKCFIYGFTTGFVGGVGINVTASGFVNVDIRDTNITNSSHGFLASAQAGGAVIGSLDNVRINDTPGFALAATTGNVFLTVRNSFLRFTGTAIRTSGGAAIINVDHSELVNSNIAVDASGAGSTIRLNDNAIHDNNTGLAISNGATIATATNNKGENPNGAAPNGSVGSF
jgi:hypothetical protein